MAMALFRTMLRQSSGSQKPHNKTMPDAQFSLGVMYDNGDGVVQDYVTAVKVVHKSRTTRQCRVPSIILAVMYVIWAMALFRTM